MVMNLVPPIHESAYKIRLVSWECEQRRFNSCNAKIKVRGEEVVGNVNTNNHAADPCRKETLRIKNADVVDAFETLAEDIGNLEYYSIFPFLWAIYDL
jgi:hypothetical protein